MTFLMKWTFAEVINLINIKVLSFALQTWYFSCCFPTSWKMLIKHSIWTKLKPRTWQMQYWALRAIIILGRNDNKGATDIQMLKVFYFSYSDPVWICQIGEAVFFTYCFYGFCVFLNACPWRVWSMQLADSKKRISRITLGCCLIPSIKTDRI